MVEAVRAAEASVEKSIAVITTVVVMFHHAIAYQHGGAHDLLAIPLTTWQTLFINGVILIVPVAGTIMLWTRWRRLGFYAIMIGMFGALVFGVAHHYMITSPDHISHLPGGPQHVHDTFVWSAGAIAILESLAAMLSAYALGRRPQ